MHACRSTLEDPTAGPAAQPALAQIPFDQHFAQRIGGAISAAMGAMAVKDGAIMLQITPDHFGRIEIEIDSRIERLQITTENDAVRSAIAQAHGRIEQELRQAGQRVTTIDVAARDGAERHDSGPATDQRGGQNAGQNGAQHSNGARHDQRILASKSGGASRDAEAEAEPPRTASNVFYA